VQRASVALDPLLESGLVDRLAPPDRTALAQCLVGRVYAAGEVVFREGEPGDTMLFVVEGRLVAVTTGSEEPGAAEQVLNVMGAGEVVGEMAVFDPAPRSATVRALEETTVYALEHDAMDALRRASPAALGALVGVAVRDLTRRLRRLDARIETELLRRRAEERRHARDAVTPTNPRTTGT